MGQTDRKVRLDRQNGKAERNWQNRTSLSGQALTGQIEQGKKNGTDRKGQTESDRQNGTSRTGKAEREKQKRDTQ
jgi:hypothetical protein